VKEKDLLDEVKKTKHFLWCRAGAGNTVEENCSVFSVIQMQ